LTPLLVAIDGAAGSGKSTLARGLARALGLPYVNTGLMYRALTICVLEAAVDPSDGDACADLMRSLRFTLSDAEPPELSIVIPGDRAPLSEELSSDDVEGSVSQVSAHPQVRALMRKTQRDLAVGGAVMEGRDIATVVLPEAQVKLYLVADAQVRARRRAGERVRARPEALHERDRRDSVVNPFTPAPDAIVIDTTDLDVDQTVQEALRLVRERIPGRER
jgi:CMP/dCMP kinase